MMQWTRKLLLPAATLIFWASLLHAQTGQSICDGISRKGTLRIKTYDAAKMYGLANCHELTELSFRKSAIQHLSSSVLKLTQLESLDLSKTQIQRFPKEIRALKNLRQLDLSFTNIYYLPPELAELSNLETLILCGTQINNLPAGLDHIRKIDMRMIDLNRDEQESLRSQYPNINIYFSSPCNCK